MRRLRDFWFGEADVAPVALLRILYGLQLFNWTWQLYPNLNAFFTDEGILPRREALVDAADRFSLLFLFGEWWQVALVWAISCAVALCVAAGWHTRLACLLAFVLVSSFSWRDPLILDGSDFVFRVLPLWLAFTGAGEAYSLDAFLRGAPGAARVWALPVRILELQVAWIYLATGIENHVGRLKSLRVTLTEKLLYDGGQLCMHQRPGTNRRRVVVKDRVERLYRRRARTRMSPCQHFVKDDPEREEVTALIDLAPVNLFR